MSDQTQDIRQSCCENGKLCINGIRSDFEVDPLLARSRPCNKWIKLSGKNPQGTNVIDEWCCSEWAKIKLTLENSQRQSQTSASVDKVATEIQKTRNSFISALPKESKDRLVLEMEKENGP